jgi:hypothetical protein
LATISGGGRGIFNGRLNRFGKGILAAARRIFLMAISWIQAVSLDDTRGAGNCHEEIVEDFQGTKRYGWTFRDLALLAELGVEYPSGEEVAGSVVLVTTRHKKVVDPCDCFSDMNAVNLLTVPWMPRVVDCQ